jgi:hypothetical protein
VAITCHPTNQRGERLMSFEANLIVCRVCGGLVSHPDVPCGEWCRGRHACDGEAPRSADHPKPHPAILGTKPERAREVRA